MTQTLFEKELGTYHVSLAFEATQWSDEMMLGNHLYKKNILKAFVAPKRAPRQASGFNLRKTENPHMEANKKNVAATFTSID